MAIEDAQYENRNTQLFTKVDFDEIMSKMQTDLNEVVKEEINIIYRMNAVMIQMLLFEAEQQNIILKNVEAKSMNNYKALESMKEYELLHNIDGAVVQSTINLTGKKQDGLGWNALGKAVMAKHNQL